MAHKFQGFFLWWC